MWVHGQFSDGKKWPDDPIEAHAWLRRNGYSQVTQVTVSTDGLHFEAQPAISREPYLRVFEHGGDYYGIVRLGHLVHSADPLEPFESGPDPFRDTPYSNKVRHVALLADGDTLHIFLSVIGAAPESILHTTLSLKGDWRDWKVGAFDEVLKPEARYECPDWPVRPSEVGEIYGAARQLRDPALYVEKGADGKEKVTLFYTVCGEQGVAAAELQDERAVNPSEQQQVVFETTLPRDQDERQPGDHRREQEDDVAPGEQEFLRDAYCVDDDDIQRDQEH